MAVYILDPNFKDKVGHYYVWAEQFVSVMRELGFEPQIIANYKCSEDRVSGVPIHKHFRRSIWHFDDRKNLLTNWDAFHQINKLLHQDLNNLFSVNQGLKTEVSSDDILIFPALVEYQLAGAIAWMNGLPPEKRPLMLTYLMAPSGCYYDPNNSDYVVHSFDTARFYKLAFRAAKNLGSRVKFFALGEAEAQAYQWLREGDVSSYPLIHPLIQSGAANNSANRKRVQLHCGALRVEKGAVFLPNLAAFCCTAYPDWQFAIQIGILDEKTIAADYLRALYNLDERYENLELTFGILSHEEYADLFQQSEIMVTPYNPEVYLNHSSGVAWEAIASANTLIVPKNTWLEREALREQAAHVAFSEISPKGIFKAIKLAIDNPAMTLEQRLLVAERFKAKNDIGILRHQIQSAMEDSAVLLSAANA